MESAQIGSKILCIIFPLAPLAKSNACIWTCQSTGRPLRPAAPLWRRPPARSACRSGVTYDLTLSRIYEDGTQELQEHHPGRQRRSAISRFESLRRSRPGIEAVKDVERRSREK